jgi:hypothetical protein
VSDDLEVEAEGISKEGGFGPGGVDGPGSVTCGRGQANIPLSALRVPFQECDIPRGWRDRRWSSWRRDFFCRGIVDCAKGTYEHESSGEIAPRSSSLFVLTKDVAHFVFLQFFISVLQVQVVKTHGLALKLFDFIHSHEPTLLHACRVFCVGACLEAAIGLTRENEIWMGFAFCKKQFE